MPTASLSPKERARRAVDAMPGDASLEDVIQRLVVIHKVERGLAEAQKGDDLMTQNEVEAYFEQRLADKRNQHNG